MIDWDIYFGKLGNNTLTAREEVGQFERLFKKHKTERGQLGNVFGSGGDGIGWVFTGQLL